MNIAVYLGSSFGNDDKYEKTIRELGTWIGKEHNLVYGGSKSGLMGALADSAVKAGGHVTGIEVEMFLESQLQHEGISELIIVPTFQERKTKMFEMADAYIAFPGGVGTLDEIAEVVSRSALNLLKGPCIFFNLDGYYENIRQQLIVMEKAGFLSEKKLDNVFFANSVDDVMKILELYY